MVREPEPRRPSPPPSRKLAPLGGRTRTNATGGRGESPTDRLAPLRGQFRRRGYRRVSHGLFLLEVPGQTQTQEQHRELRAWLEVLPEGAVFTHLTAAMLRGWELPKLPEQVPVFAAVRGTARRPRRHGLVCSRITAAASSEKRHGLPVDAPEEVLLRAARDLGLLDLVVLIDSALRHGDLNPTAMGVVLESGRPGVRALRTAWQRSSKRSESPGESLLRLMHNAFEVVVHPQTELRDAGGALLGRVDLWVVGTHRAHEYDGAVHRDGVQHRTDLRRERGVNNAGYERHGYTLDDLLNHAGVVMHEMDRALGREHQPRRLTRWRVLVEQSLYSEPGRRRLMNRWNRQMGLAQWRASS